MKTRTGLLSLVTTLAGVTLLFSGCSKPSETPATPPQSTALPSPPPATAALPSTPLPGTAAPTATAGAEASDTDLTSKVKSALLLDADVKGLDIAVETLKGDVKLTGFVNNQSQIDAAVKVASSVDGVHSVHPELSIKK
jgi:BON domain